MELFSTTNEGDKFTNGTGMTAVVDKKVHSKKNAALRVRWEQEVENGQNGRGIKIFNPLHFMQ